LEIQLLAILLSNELIATLAAWVLGQFALIHMKVKMAVAVM